jgi:hypothetical protein
MVRPIVVIEVEVASMSEHHFRDGLIIVRVDLSILDAAPETFGEDVVERSAAPAHTDLNPALIETISKGSRAKLRAPIRVDNFRLADDSDC